MSTFENLQAANLWQVDISWAALNGSSIDSILVDLGAESATQPGADYFRTAPAVRAIRTALDVFERREYGGSQIERRIDSIKVTQTATLLVKA
jgi:hypothetical protein